MPLSRKGQGGVTTLRDDDLGGQQGGTEKKSRMAPQPTAPPGLEQDAHGNAIPFEERTPEDQEKTRSDR